jgi:hypothetical protein
MYVSNLHTMQDADLFVEKCAESGRAIAAALKELDSI